MNRQMRIETILAPVNKGFAVKKERSSIQDARYDRTYGSKNATIKFPKASACIWGAIVRTTHDVQYVCDM